MNISIFVEGNSHIGLGHLYRCAAIADCFELNGHNTRIIIPEDTPDFSLNTHKTIKLKNSIWQNPIDNITLYTELTKNDDIILFDVVEEQFKKFSFYAKTDKYIASVTLFRFNDKSYFGNISFFPNTTSRINIVKTTRIITGPELFIVRDSIRKVKGLKRKTLQTPICLVSMGGADPYQITKVVISALESIRLDYTCYVITGEANKHGNEIIHYLSNKKQFICIEKVSKLEQIYSKIDCAIINGGNTRYELTYLQIPYCCISIHQQQFSISADVVTRYGGKNLGVYNKIEKEFLVEQFKTLLFDKEFRATTIKMMNNFEGGKGDKLIYKHITEGFIKYNNEKID